MAGTVRNIGVNVKLGGATEFKSQLDLIRLGFEKVKKIVDECVNGSIEYESALAGLQKTAGLSDTALSNMSDKIMDMSERIPKTSTEIAELADEFAHLGLSSDQLLPFTEVMIKLGDTTDMSASEAGTALAQLMNVMGTTSAEYENLASTILYLGMTSATTESKITEMAQGMSGSGKLFGMDEADILALSAALSSMGIEAAAGATGIQKLGNRIELMVYGNNTEKLKQFADVAGMTSEAFAEMWEADPSGAINAFVAGLGQINDAGDSAINVLNELGITGVREQKVIAQMAAGNELVTRSLGNASAAWEENSTLAESTAIIYETTASRISMADNAIANAQIAIGDGLKGIKLQTKEIEAGIAQDVRASLIDNSLNAQMDEITAKYAETFQSIELTRTKVTSLIDTIQSMGDVSQMSAEDQMLYNAAVQALADIIPDVSKAYDAETGAINGGTDALREMAEAHLDAAEAQTKTQQSLEQVEAYQIAEQNLQELEIEMLNAKAEYDALSKAAEDYWNSQEEGHDFEGDQTLQDIRLKVEDARNEYESLTDDVETATAQLQQQADVVADAAENTDALNDANRRLAEVNGEASDSETELINRLQMFSEELGVAYAAYEEYRENVQKTLESSLSGLGEFNYDPDTSFSDLEANMQKRLQFLTEYQTNLQKAQEMGYSTEFLSQFTDGTTESAETLAGLVTASSSQVETMNTNYESLKTKTSELSTSLATAATGVDTTAAEITAAVDGLTTSTDVDLSASGAATVQSLIDGMNSKINTLRTKANTITGIVSGAGKTRVVGGDARHAQGLAYVPYDDYPALLHRGEMVLTSAEAAAYRATEMMSAGTAALRAGMTGGGTANYSTSNTQNVSFGTVVVREEADIEKIAVKIAQLNKRNAYGRGVR